MTGAEFVDYLYRKYYPELEGPILAVRKALAELDTRSPQFISLMQRQAKRKLSHGIAFTKALLQYKELTYHERADVAAPQGIGRLDAIGEAYSLDAIS